MPTDHQAMSAKDAGMAACHQCHHLNEWHEDAEDPRCHKCDGSIYQRKHDSFNRTLALTITSLIAFIPANAYPIMTILYFGKGQPDTILSGIILLIKLGIYPIAAVVFIASFLIPLAKILGLFVMLYALKYKSRLTPTQCTKMYRFIEFFGRWSMLDVFVVALLVALVEIGEIVEIVAGPGATAFGVMVILTIFAAECYDPRLIWDKDPIDEQR